MPSSSLLFSTSCRLFAFAVWATLAISATAAGPMTERAPFEFAPRAALEGSFSEHTQLAGDWFGFRSALNDRGITVDVSNTQFYQGVTCGGLEQAFSYGGRNDYFIDADGEKLGFRDGSSVSIHGETRYGQAANAFTGALMPVNLMLDVPQSSGTVTALTGVKFTQRLSANLSVYGGKINTADGFEQPLSRAGVLNGFQNTAFIFNPVYSQTIPYSTLGAGVAYIEGDDTLFEIMALDTYNTPTVSGFESLFNNGVTIFTQTNVPTSFFRRPGHQGLSGTYSSGKYSELSPSAYLDPILGIPPPTSRIAGSWSIAYNGDQALHVCRNDPKRMWGVFWNLGIADSNPSPVRWFASFGVSGNSPLPQHEQDTFGFGCYYVGVSSPLKDLAPPAAPIGNEQGLEAYYNLAVTRWCQVTPDLQVITPFQNGVNASLLFGLRAKIDF